MTGQRVVGGRYEVGEVIGWGATADVHRGRDSRSGRTVAVKILRKELARDSLFRSRFRREAETVAALSHPAIVSIHDVGYEDVSTEGVGGAPGEVLRVPFIVMEHVAGRSLRDLLRVRALTLNETVQYQAGILAGLDVSHRAGIVHRDIKPANVLVTPEGAVKIVDFGIARWHGDLAATLTQVPILLGTPSYLSPEQAQGELADARSDIYSAGCVLYQLLTGQPPFVGDDPVSVVYQHVHEQPAPLRTRRPELDRVVARALAKHPDDRFQDAGSFRAALLSATRRDRERRGVPRRRDLEPRATGSSVGTVGAPC